MLIPHCSAIQPTGGNEECKYHAANRLQPSTMVLNMLLTFSLNSDSIQHVCLSVCLLAYTENHSSNFHQILCGHGLVLL